MDDIIVVENITKRFEKVEALCGISFNVRQGELFGFLGPNGSGKTTTINILTGLARTDSGKINISGIDCTKSARAAQRLIGVVPDESNLYPELTGFENLNFCAALYGMRKVERQARARKLLDDFGLSKAAGRKFGGYSKGMKRKLTIAAGIIHNPKILFLDEPTTGIDVAGARQLRQLIDDLHRGGTTIFLTTHYIEEAERLCDRIAFIVSGRIVQVDTVKHLIQPIQDKHVVQIACADPPEDMENKLCDLFPGIDFTAQKSGVIRAASDAPIRVGLIIRFLEDQGVEVTEARKIQPSLEEIFVRITGIEADNMRKEKEKKGEANETLDCFLEYFA